MLVRTCASLLARRGELESARPDRLTPGAFAEVRDRLAAAAVPYSTIRPFLQACSAAVAP